MNEDVIPPLNQPEDEAERVVLGVMCSHYPDKPDFGYLHILTIKGHYSFMITMKEANEAVQALRDFIAGDSEPLVEGPDEG